jgi:hypothetical protein
MRLAEIYDIRGWEGWINFTKSGKLPDDITPAPWSVYRDQYGSMSNWLGRGGGKPGYLSYDEALDIARERASTLNITSGRKWAKACLTKRIPDCLPSNPDSFYDKSGWKNWGEWLGTNSKRTKPQDYISFAEARRFVHKFIRENNIQRPKDNKSLQAFLRSVLRTPGFPNNIPRTPWRTYANQGWVGYKDFMGLK